MLTLLVACLLIYKLDLPQWLYLVAMAVWALEVGVGGSPSAPKIESLYFSKTS